jgi:hypothetical protein
LGKRLLHHVTKMTSLSRIHHDFLHKEIVSGRSGSCASGGGQVMVCNVHIRSGRTVIPIELSRA